MPSTAGTPKPRINSNGVVVFAGRLTGPDVVSTNSGGIWKWSAGTQQLVARWGEVAPGTAETFKFCWDPHVDSLDRILVPARIASGSSPDGYWFGPSGSLSLVVTKGQQAPGMIAGVTFGTLDSNPLLASNGDIAFHVTLLGTGISTANDSSVWQWSNGTFTCLVQEGQAAPGLIAGTLFGTQAAISISPSGRVLFAGSLTGESLTSSNNSALWMETTSGVQMVAREGDQGPGATAGSVFSGFTASELQAAINVHDEIVFGLDVGFNPVAGVWGWTDWNGVFPIAPPGGALYANDALIGTIVEAFISSFDAAVNDSFSTTLNNDGQFAIKVNLASKTGFQGVFRGSMPVFGDINGDLHVNIQDLLLVIASWGPCPCDQPCNEDINESRIVNVSDLLLVIANWG
jgi:hypothetical protein